MMIPMFRDPRLGLDAGLYTARVTRIDESTLEYELLELPGHTFQINRSATTGLFWQNAMRLKQFEFQVNWVNLNPPTSPVIDTSSQ